MREREGEREGGRERDRMERRLGRCAVRFLVQLDDEQASTCH